MNLKKIFGAYEFAKEAHRGQFRKNPPTEHYIEHPSRVAQMIYDCYPDEEAICAALLHDVVEDTSHTLEEISAKFGNKVSFIVDGVTKTSINGGTLEKIREFAEKDRRVALVKLADRIDNTKTIIDSMEWKERCAILNTEFYIPLGIEFGYEALSKELEKLTPGLQGYRDIKV